MVAVFYYVIDTMYIYSWKKKYLNFDPLWWCTLPKVYFVSVAHGVQLYNGVTPHDYMYTSPTIGEGKHNVSYVEPVYC